MLLQPHCLPK